MIRWFDDARPLITHKDVHFREGAGVIFLQEYAIEIELEKRTFAKRHIVLIF